MNKIKYNSEVLHALEHNLPIVALESTIISHGMPYPANLEVAKKCEQIVRDNGAVPATVAIINGEIIVGVTEEQLEYLATSKEVLKVSRRDFAYVIANKLSGATTVAATMMIAKMANIALFATGGIGGVHRGVEQSWDISADLEELATTDVCVVCAGAKSILDLEKTLEYLETKGVLVVGYQTNELPAFFTKESGIEIPIRMDSPLEIAKVLKTKKNLNITQGILITNPIDGKYSLNKKEIDETISNAIKEMEEQNIKGKKVTPYLLSKINELTKGESLNANKQLVYSNCKLAALIAVELKNYEQDN
ncbi:MAG: pseudouridine-5'-phosphate glycosidase [Bacilli bacterium]|nr:pseudouridine-5'-phosphate glycosidase [Bacilli bacterium]